MPTALVLAPLTLVAVLVVSGLAKRVDPDNTLSMMGLLRLPVPLVRRPVAAAVPWVELGLAALLLVPLSWVFVPAAVGTLVLFLIFWGIIARAMTFDPRPSCGCFGRLGDHRVNGRTVTRNTILVVLAALTLWVALSGHTATGMLVELSGDDLWWLLLAVVLAAVAVLVLGAPPAPRTSPEASANRRSRATAPPAPGAPDDLGGTPDDTAEDDEAAELDYIRAELDYIREPIPTGVLVDADHQAHELRALARQRAQLVVLANCWCGPTVRAIQQIPTWRAELPQLDVVLAHTLRPFEAGPTRDMDGIYWDPGAQVARVLEVRASPAAVLLGADGLLAGGPVQGYDEVEEFVGDIAAQLAEAAEQAEQAAADEA